MPCQNMMKKGNEFLKKIMKDEKCPMKFFKKFMKDDKGPMQFFKKFMKCPRKQAEPKEKELSEEEQIELAMKLSLEDLSKKVEEA